MGACRAQPEMVTQPDELIRGEVPHRGVGGHSLVEDVVATEASQFVLNGRRAENGDLMASTQELLDNPRLDKRATGAVPHYEEEATLPDLSLSHLASFLSVVMSATDDGHKCTSGRPFDMPL